MHSVMEVRDNNPGMIHLKVAYRVDLRCSHHKKDMAIM